MNKYNDDNMLWKVHKSECIFRSPWLTVNREEVELPNGKTLDDFYVLHYPTWINVIAITEDGQFVLERQYRHAISQVCTEICAGCAEEDEDPLTAAKRELLEETGYTGGTWTKLMTIVPNGTSMDNFCHCYLAEGVRKVSGQHLDESEDINVFLRSKEDVYQMLLDGEFIHSLMCAPLWKYFATKG